MRMILAAYNGNYAEEFFTMERAECLTPELAEKMVNLLEELSGSSIKIEDINFYYCEPIKVSTKIVIE